MAIARAALALLVLVLALLLLLLVLALLVPMPLAIAVEQCATSMDARIFHGDKTGWMACCQRRCTIQWNKSTEELELAALRAKWLSFFRCRFNRPGDPGAVIIR